MNLKRKLFTVKVMFTVNLKRVFRDRTALLWTFMFPLIFLIVFGLLFGHSQDLSFNIALVNHSSTPFAKQFVMQAESKDQKLLKVDQSITTMAAADEKMTRSELDATIELPSDFGAVKPGESLPSGQAVVYYTQNSEQAAQTLVAVLQSQFQATNVKLVKSTSSLTAVPKLLNTHALTRFDYAFTGLLGFAIMGMGVFGPMNIFPELKKMGILRRLHTTPLRVWQYFLATMLGQAVVGLMAIAFLFAVAVAFFHLKVVGNYIELAIFLVLSIAMILGIGLSLGGWAKNERQVAPLANIIVFPMMFLTGVFIPRYVMPEWLQNITAYIPLTPVIDGARLIATEGKHLIDLGPQLGVMAIWTIIIYIIAFRVFRWE